MCPEGLTGELCESVKQEDNCQKENHLVIGSIGETVTLESTNYPNSYPTGSTCRWLVEGPEGSKLRVTILDMDIVSANGHCVHGMELRYNLIAQPGPEFCGDNKGQMMSFTASDNAEAHSMLITFITTTDVSSSGSRGFKLEFKALQGNNATNPVNFCENVQCKNGGTCHFNDNNYWCSCLSDFRGRHCEVASDQNLQDDQDTVFSCDDTNMDECGHIDLGNAWELKDGHFTVKQGQKGPVSLQIPYVISQLDQQYCFHFKISRTSSSSSTTCPNLRFILTKEMDFYGIQMVYDEHLLFDDDCTPRTDDSEAVSFTSDAKITKMAFTIDKINDDDGKIELSHFRLQLSTCS
ncbi:protein SpAN-like [Pecten maximus]|uniref:protein SpAN-like n=1 Tax=Pecten maximus TaxID=6579 RepID=UPI001457FA4A|nr:protein SpAN-like [Pecten maximus]